MQSRSPSNPNSAANIRAREGESSARIPIIAMTADAMMGTKERCLKTGMDDYISKPVRLDVLMRILEKWAVEVVKK